jgi:hypothetical protein
VIGVCVDLEAEGVAVERDRSHEIGDVEMTTHRRDDRWCCHGSSGNGLTYNTDKPRNSETAPRPKPRTALRSSGSAPFTLSPA